jgi:acyl-CoA reductase-like NAD-dependent aldehyde dehydrogenase
MIEYNNLSASKKNSGKYVEVLNPLNGEIVGKVPSANEGMLDDALSSAYDIARNRKKWLKPYERIAILEKFISIFKSNFDDILDMTIKEGAKPYADSKVEVVRAIDSFQSCIDELKAQSGEVIPMNITPSSANRLAFSTHEPIGVVVALSAFNHPVNLIAHQVGPAIAAGCPVIIKPATDTPLSCFNIIKMLLEAGLPQEYAQVVLPTDNEHITKLVTDSRVSFFAFIGSSEVGWMLRSKVAKGVRCALEHGGVAPVIVASDAKIPEAVASVAKGGFYHAGQVCVSSQRIYVHNDIFDDFTSQITASAQNLEVGDSLKQNTEIGPLIRNREVKRVDEWVQDALKNNASLACGGNRISDSLYEPTILINPSSNAIISNKEIFGPVIALYKYNDDNEAIKWANSLDFSFQSAIFSQDISKIMNFYKNIDASACMANDHSAFRVDWMPFAGLKHSGLSVGGIKYTLEEMQIKKMLVIKDDFL